MCAMPISDENRVRRVHLEDTDGKTLCGFLPQYITDHNVATGWPDCDECIKKTEADKPAWLS